MIRPRPDRAGRAATLISWVRMVAPRARACTGEASTRKAAQLTQEDLAARLVKGKAALSKLGRRKDLLLSMLASYIHAAGAEAQLVVTVDGKKLRYDLAQLGTVDGRRR